MCVCVRVSEPLCVCVNVRVCVLACVFVRQCEIAFVFGMSSELQVRYLSPSPPAALLVCTLPPPLALSRSFTVAHCESVIL